VNSVPSNILGSLESRISLASVRQQTTYKTSSYQLFENLVVGCDVKYESKVLRVSRHKHSGICVRTSTENQTFDNIIFACNATSILNILEEPSFLEKNLFGNLYRDSDDIETSIIHTDETIIPEEFRKKALENTYYIEEQGDGSWEYTRILSNFPVFKQRKDVGFSDPYLFVTYNTKKLVPRDKIFELIQTPCLASTLTFKHHLISKGIGLIQGFMNTYFCGLIVTPGDCIDYSFVSGLVVAHAIDHESYPYDTDPKCKSDFDSLCSWMGL